LIRDALSAAPPSLAATATVMDWDHKVLRQGSGGYTCHPTQPALRKKGGREPMCLDKVWIEWADAWANKKPFKANQVGVAYMMAGDTGASNTDPFAEVATGNNQWVVEGPHIMVIMPDPAQLEAYRPTRTTAALTSCGRALLMPTSWFRSASARRPAMNRRP
jgi:hypothetical protein